ncbi:MAG: agmatine deiminase family protein [Pseudomonadota bacterium]
MADSNIRVPAEWEPQAATWLQWPGPYERQLEPAFAEMAAVIVQYQSLHILYSNSQIKRRAQNAVASVGGDPNHANLIWHEVRNDSAWMRDNGPVYVIRDGELRVQNWEFDAWGGAFGSDVPYDADNRIPDYVGDYLRLPVDDVPIVHERGNLEFNGTGTVILNWSTLGDPRRNPDYSKAKATADLKRHFGVHTVVFIEGVPDGDLTNGHVDGIARFISEDTVVVPECMPDTACGRGNNNHAKVFDDAARAITDAGLSVIRDPVEGFVRHNGLTFDTDYMNWIVGNGFVIVVGFGDPYLDSRAQERIQGYFPDRDIHLITMLDSWASGGGAHCHTNDQPLFPVGS